MWHKSKNSFFFKKIMLHVILNFKIHINFRWTKNWLLRFESENWKLKSRMDYHESKMKFSKKKKRSLVFLFSFKWKRVMREGVIGRSGSNHVKAQSRCGHMHGPVEPFGFHDTFWGSVCPERFIFQNTIGGNFHGYATNNASLYLYLYLFCLLRSSSHVYESFSLFSFEKMRDFSSIKQTN